jgi:hypothetical protein
MKKSQPPAKPRGLLKWGFNLPILLYRARLGWLLGHRFLLLSTTAALARVMPMNSGLAPTDRQ